jgi:hypothetical protein
MKYVKMLGLAALAAMAVMALVGAGTASATELYSGATTLKAGTEVDASVTGSSFKMSTTENAVLDECAGGTIKGKTSNNGSSTETVKGSVAKVDLTWSSCTRPTETLAGGTLEIHYTSGLNGTVTASGLEITINTIPFGTCTYITTSGTSLGSLTGSTTSNAVLHINTTATLKSGPACPADARWIATYTVTSPKPLHVTTS